MRRVSNVLVRIQGRIAKGTPNSPKKDRHEKVDVHADLLAGECEAGALFITGTLAENLGLKQGQIWTAVVTSDDTPEDSEYQRQHQLIPEFQITAFSEIREVKRDLGLPNMLEIGAPGSKADYAAWLKEKEEARKITEKSEM